MSAPAVPSPSAAAPRRQPLYFVNGPVDFLLAGGLSIVVFTALRMWYVDERTSDVIYLAAILLWIGNWPHFAATNYRLYHSWTNIRQYPFTALLIPWVIAALAAASLWRPEQAAPYFVKLFLIWSPYHFSGQTLGVTLIYARRAGVPLTGLTRRGLSLFIYGTFITMTLRNEANPAGGTYFSVPYPGLGTPLWMAHVAEAVMWAGGGLFLVGLAAWCWRERRWAPPILLVAPLAQYTWFVGGGGWQSFIEFVPFFHSLQYLLVAWSMQLQERLTETGRQPSRSYVLGESARWMAINIVVGAGLFWLLPRGAAFALGAPLGVALGVVTAAVQVHHFFVDGVIWKLKRQTVASPLMGSVGELWRPAAAETTGAVAPAVLSQNAVAEAAGGPLVSGPVVR